MHRERRTKGLGSLLETRVEAGGPQQPTAGEALGVRTGARGGLGGHMASSGLGEKLCQAARPQTTHPLLGFSRGAVQTCGSPLNPARGELADCSSPKIPEPACRSCLQVRVPNPKRGDSRLKRGSQLSQQGLGEYLQLGFKHVSDPYSHLCLYSNIKSFCFPERCKCRPIKATQKTYLRNNYNYVIRAKVKEVKAKCHDITAIVEVKEILKSSLVNIPRDTVNLYTNSGCLCPPLNANEEYIIMGYEDEERSRLLLVEGSIAEKWKDRLGKKVKRWDQKLRHPGKGRNEPGQSDSVQKSGRTSNPRQRRN
ncbi:secreted frizzled-related protein 3 [Sphaerodactylus townsendi]|uniref:secreted frizzled-related protein 3 n=1 Tax=Sphaerodactylus townsendi TaxID=933632 RepID=UPI0020260226|nr:secreted frizzled-related protein 3 [Sphaerodactylus townsendi]